VVQCEACTTHRTQPTYRRCRRSLCASFFAPRVFNSWDMATKSGSVCISFNVSGTRDPGFYDREGNIKICDERPRSHNAHTSHLHQDAFHDVCRR